MVEEEGKLRFKDVPWPLFDVKGGKKIGDIGGTEDESWVKDAVREFLLENGKCRVGLSEVERTKKRKDTLREGIRRSVLLSVFTRLSYTLLMFVFFSR